jgi:putative isomerase
LTEFSARTVQPGLPAPGAPAQAWNTWDANWPASLVHLASGSCVRIGAYSASAGSYTAFPWSADYTLGTHRVDGGLIEAEFSHAGTALSLRAEAVGEHAVHAELRVSGLQEWGLRFWVVLEFGSWGDGGPATQLLVPDGEHAYTDPPVAIMEDPHGLSAALCTLERPVDARLSAQWGAVGRAMERFGYYARPRPPEQGRLAVFRFITAEPVITFAVAAGEDPAAALESARRALAVGPAARPAPAVPDGPESHPTAGPDGPESHPTAGPDGAGPEPGNHAAVRDVLGWNTVWDRRNGRAYTASTRAWIEQKFGGFGVWQIDGFLHAVLAAHLGESWLAWANVDAVLAGRSAEGNLAALAAGSTYWQDRSHPPYGAHVLWTVQAMVPDGGQLSQAAGILLRAFDWWFEARDGNRNGVLEYGSSPAGDGHFVHTRQAAMDESANDNSPVYDGTRFDLATHTLDLEDVGLNSLLVHEGQLLAGLLEADGGASWAGETPDGRASWAGETPDGRTEARRVADRAAALAEAVRTRLWDPEREIFAGRRWDGRFTASLSPTSFYPLLAGIATREQAEAMVARWLTDPGRFGGDWPVAGTPHEDPAAADNVYWRGRTWPCFNYAVYLGLRRYRFDAEASWLAARGQELFDRGWAKRRSYENFNQRTGEGGDSPDAEPFYTWGALLPYLADADLIGVDPWDGVTFGRQGSDEAAASTSIGGMALEVRLTAGSTVLSRAGHVLLTAGLRGRFRRLEITPGRLAAEIPPAAGPATLEVTLEPPVTVVRVDGTALPSDRLEHSAAGSAGPTGSAGLVSVRLDPADHPRHVEFLA